MAALNRDTGAPPAFLSKNYVNSDAKNNGGTFTATTNQGQIERVYDGDPYSYWEDANGVDGESQVITIDLYEAAAAASRSIDLVALLNVNLKNFKVEYFNGTWNIFTGADYQSGVANFSAEDLIISLASPVTGVTQLRITMTHTQTANQKKKVGEIVAALADYQMARPFDRYDKDFEEMRRIVRLGNGSEDVVRTKRSAVSYEWYRASVFFSLVSETERDVLRRIKREGKHFLWYPEPGERKRDIFYCRFEGAWKDRYSSPFKGAGFDVGFTVREVAGG